eukprot:10179373-Alexandrium_andersonii.AAC.1
MGLQSSIEYVCVVCARGTDRTMFWYATWYMATLLPMFRWRASLLPKYLASVCLNWRLTRVA